MSILIRFWFVSILDSCKEFVSILDTCKSSTTFCILQTTFWYWFLHRFLNLTLDAHISLCRFRFVSILDTCKEFVSILDTCKMFVSILDACKNFLLFLDTLRFWRVLKKFGPNSLCDTTGCMQSLDNCIQPVVSQSEFWPNFFKTDLFVIRASQNNQANYILVLVFTPIS